MNICGATWDCGGFEPDRPWHGLPCVRPPGHDGHDDWHETAICHPPVINGRITWLEGR